MNCDNIDTLISIVTSSNYLNAFDYMKAYFISCDCNKRHCDLDNIAMHLYRMYSKYNELVVPVLNLINGDILIRVIQISQYIYETVNEFLTLNEYKTILPSSDFEFIKSTFDDDMVNSLNVLVGLTKYNALYHRIKDYFVPLYCERPLG